MIINKANICNFLTLSIISLDTEDDDKKVLLQLKREQNVKDLTQKLSSLPMSPQDDRPSRVGDLSGMISKAKEELARSKSKGDVKTNIEADIKKPEAKKSEIEMHWEELVQNMERDLTLCDLDFRDLTQEDEINVLRPQGLSGLSIPPPPPPNGILRNGNVDAARANIELNGKGSDDGSSIASKKTKKTVSKYFNLKRHRNFTVNLNSFDR